MLEGLFYQNDVLGAAMKAAVTRNEIINNNIANADTPGYRRKYVTFEPFLLDAVEKNKRTGGLDLSAAKPAVNVDNSTYQYRMDGNGVDMQTEMADLYINSARYDMFVSGISSNYKRIGLISQLK